MFFYDNQLELDELNLLPMNYISTIKIDQYDQSKAWIATSNSGQIYRIDVESLQADYHFEPEQHLTDLISTDKYLYCLSRNKLQLFNIQQSIDRKLDDHEMNRTNQLNKLRSNRKRKLNEDLDLLIDGISSENCEIKENNLIIKFDSHLNLNCLCKINNNQLLLSGCQNDMFLFDTDLCKVVKTAPLFNEKNCFKMKKIESKNLIATSTIGGLITFYDLNSLRPTSNYRAFSKTINDFDVINENYILTIGSNTSFSTGAKNLSVYDLRAAKEMILFDQSRFYRACFVKSLSEFKSLLGHNCLTIDNSGSVELSNVIDDVKSLLSYDERFSIPLCENATICAYDISAERNILLTADKNGFIHSTLIKDDKLTSEQTPESKKGYEEEVINEHFTKHLQIDNDLTFKSSVDHSPKSTDKLNEPVYDFLEPKRDLKVKPNYFLQYFGCAAKNICDDFLKEITFSKIYNRN